MKGLFVLLLAGALLLGGCGTGGTSDLATVAGAIREVEQKGAVFSYTDTLLDSGGSVPKGTINRIRLAAVGQERDDNAALVLSQLDNAGKPVGGYDLVINDAYLFVRPHGSTRDWFVGSAAYFNQFYPGVRLNLLQESVLLAKGVTKSTSYTNGGFYSQYTVTPASDQLEQLTSMVLTPDKEAKFLKSASATITAYLSTTGNHLQRIDIHLSGTDPDTGLKRVFDSSLSFSKVGQAATPAIPATAVPVQPVDMFSTGAAPSAPTP